MERKLVRLALLLLVIIFLATAINTTSAQQSPAPGPYDNALVHGTIYNVTENGTTDLLQGYVVRIYREDFIPRSNTTDADGKYEIYVPDSSEHYIFEIRDTDGDIVKRRNINVSKDQPLEVDIEVHFDKDDGEETNWLTPEKMFELLGIVLKFLWVGLPWIIIGVLGVAAIVAVIPITINLFDKLKDKEFKYFPLEFVKITEQFVLALFSYIFGSVEYLMISLLFDLSPGTNDVARKIITAIGVIVFLFFLLRVLLVGLRIFIAYLRKKFEEKERLIPSRILMIVEFILKYVLIFAIGFLMMLVILAAFGFRELIVASIVTFFITKWGFIIFIVLLIIIAVSVQKFSTTLFQDLRSHQSKEKKMSSAMMFIIEKGFKFGLYTVLIMIAIFTVLSALGMGEIGQTLVLMISMIIGFVVSMAATGSIGNALSGVVLYSFRPIEKGDRVTISIAGGAEITGDVSNIDLMFTTIEDLESEMVKVPNNQILATKIVNHTKSEPGGYAVVVEATIGYDVPAETVKELMRTAAISTEGVLKDPKPNVLLTEFHNHAIGYKLRAYISNSKALYATRSAIMRNMQKHFHNSGIEILSPLYHVKRDETMPTSEGIIERYKKASEKAEKKEDFQDEEAASAAFMGLESLHAFDDEETGPEPASEESSEYIAEEAEDEGDDELIPESSLEELGIMGEPEEELPPDVEELPTPDPDQHFFKDDDDPVDSDEPKKKKNRRFRKKKA